MDIAADSSVLIYTRGKVGSRTIAESIAAPGLDIHVLSTHSLSLKRISEIDAYWISQTGKPHPETIFNKLLRKKVLRAIETGKKLHVITAVRDGISTHLSGFFHNARTLHPEIYIDDASIDVDKAMQMLTHRLSIGEAIRDDFSNWFDAEIKDVFGVDVFDYPFDRERGFAIIDHPKIKLLILRTDRLGDVLTDALYQFMGVRIIQKNANTAKNKAYGAAYGEMKNKLVLPEALCQKIYSNRFSRHFFSEREREELIARYSQNA